MRLLKIIINADDCGSSVEVNKEIENCIKNGKITSTTIMANMLGFEGAVNLYNSYKDIISFGWHANLTEGSPLTKSQLLLDKGYYKEVDGKVLFNGKAYWKRIICHSMAVEIEKELLRQLERLYDNGIRISHIDSHQHIHTSPSMFFLFPKLLKRFKINRCRRIRNNVASLFSRLSRNVWTIPYKFNGIRMTDSFCSFEDFYKNRSIPHGELLELMIHPGHPSKKYSDEYELLKLTDVSLLGGTLITYNDI